jgi:putative transposase
MGRTDGRADFSVRQAPSQIYRNAVTQWEQAWINHWKNPAHFRRPTHRTRGEADSVWLTRELFGIVARGRIRVGSKTRDLGVLFFKEHRRYREPASVTISRTPDGRWWLSLTFDDGVKVQKPEAILEELRLLSAEQLEAMVVGNDRGVVRQMQSSDGRTLAFTEAKKAKIKHWNRRIKKLNRKLARQTNKTSKRRAKTRHKLARTHARVADLRRDQAHQVSHVAVQTPARVLAFEDLRLRNMVARPKPVPNESGTGHKPNGAAAKAGLNRSIHNAAMGMILQFVRYKAARVGKLVLTVPAHHSSQECSQCGHTCRANRPSQAEFHCQACGHTENADANASRVIKKRGLAALQAELWAPGRGADQLPVEATGRRKCKPALQGANEAGFFRSAHLAA